MSSRPPSTVGRFLMSCRDCGTVVERWYTREPTGKRGEVCPSCDVEREFKHVLTVEDAGIGGVSEDE